MKKKNTILNPGDFFLFKKMTLFGRKDFVQSKESSSFYCPTMTPTVK